MQKQRYRLRSGLMLIPGDPATVEYARNQERLAAKEEIDEWQQARTKDREPEEDKPQHKRKKGDPVKVRAGWAGWRARWRHVLEWHRRWQTEDPDTFFDGDWHRRLLQAVFRAILLYRSAIRGAKAEEELAGIGCGLSLWRLRALANEMSHAPRETPKRRKQGHRIRRRHRIWSRHYIAWILDAPWEWRDRLMIRRLDHQQTDEQRIMVRRGVLLQILAQYRDCPSIRSVQKLLADRGIKAGYSTVRDDLEKLRRLH